MDMKYYDHPEETRALQGSESAINANIAWMKRFGLYNLVKIREADAADKDSLEGYITLLSHVSGKTPDEMRVGLGLKDIALQNGAQVWRLLRLPERHEFAVRGYTSLVDGLRLLPQFDRDGADYRRGQSLWQVKLTQEIPAVFVAKLKPGEAFKPGMHPSIQKLYGRG